MNFVCAVWVCVCVFVFLEFRFQFWFNPQANSFTIWLPNFADLWCISITNVWRNCIDWKNFGRNVFSLLHFFDTKNRRFLLQFPFFRQTFSWLYQANKLHNMYSIQLSKVISIKKKNYLPFLHPAMMIVVCGLWNSDKSVVFFGF